MVCALIIGVSSLRTRIYLDWISAWSDDMSDAVVEYSKRSNSSESALALHQGDTNKGRVNQWGNYLSSSKSNLASCVSSLQKYRTMHVIIVGVSNWSSDAHKSTLIVVKKPNEEGINSIQYAATNSNFSWKGLFFAADAETDDILFCVERCQTSHINYLLGGHDGMFLRQLELFLLADYQV